MPILALLLGIIISKKYELAWEHIKIAQELGVKVTEEQLNAIKNKLQ